MHIFHKIHFERLHEAIEAGDKREIEVSLNLLDGSLKKSKTKSEELFHELVNKMTIYSYTLEKIQSQSEKEKMNSRVLEDLANQLEELSKEIRSILKKLIKYEKFEISILE